MIKRRFCLWLFNLEDIAVTIRAHLMKNTGLNLIDNKNETIGENTIIPARSCKIFRVK